MQHKKNSEFLLALQDGELVSKKFMFDKKGRKQIYTLSKDEKKGYKLVKRTVVYESQLTYYCAVFGEERLFSFSKYPDKLNVSDPQWCLPYYLQPSLVKDVETYLAKLATAEDLMSDIGTDIGLAVKHQEEFLNRVGIVEKKLQAIISLGFDAEFLDEWGVTKFLEDNGMSFEITEVPVDEAVEEQIAERDEACSCNGDYKCGDECSCENECDCKKSENLE